MSSPMTHRVAAVVQDATITFGPVLVELETNDVLNVFDEVAESYCAERRGGRPIDLEKLSILSMSVMRIVGS